MTVALRDGAGWRMRAPEPVGDVATLMSRLRSLAQGGAAVLGVDFAIGVPRAYAAAHVAEADFPAFLGGLRTRPDFFDVCATLEQIGAGRPFYPARGLAGMSRAAHAAALGLDGAGSLSRRCDRATDARPAGAPLFWTLGANQTGKATIAAWRDFLLPALAAEAPPLLWPFAGNLEELLASGGTVVAETYPAEALRHLGLRMQGSKRRQGDRTALAGPMLAVMARLAALPDAALSAAINDGFGASAFGEDKFDCVLGAICVVNVLAGNRPGGVPDDPELRRWEGWVLGQTADMPPTTRAEAAMAVPRRRR